MIRALNKSSIIPVLLLSRSINLVRLKHQRLLLRLVILASFKALSLGLCSLKSYVHFSSLCIIYVEVRKPENTNSLSFI